MEKKRNSNIEFLRILAMLFIVIHHAIVHGVLGEYVGGLYTKLFFAEHLTTIAIADMAVILGKTGVDVFVIITGYFMVASNIKVSKLIKLWLPIWLYSVLGLITGGLSGNFGIGISDLIRALFPISFGEYWFMTAYVVLYCAIPLLNVLWASLSPKLRIYMLVLLFICAVAVPTFLGMNLANFFGSNRASQFVFLYFVGAFLRSKHILDSAHIILGRLLSYGSWGLYASTVAIFIFLARKMNVMFFAIHAQHFSRDGSLLVLGMAVGLIIMIGSRPVKSNNFINRLASSVFAVYLIHDNSYLRILIWHNWLHMEHLVQYPVWSMVILVLGTSLVVFTVATVIDLMRAIIFKNLEGKTVAFISNSIKKAEVYFSQGKMVQKLVRSIK